jgi:sacsin
MLETDKSSAFGQHEELTTRLASLVRQYPAGPGIIKEFIQNADDAGATRVDVIVDWRDHGKSIAPDNPIRPLLGPALLIANDAVFSDENFRQIRSIGDSGKRLDWSKLGRFGVGFNTAYNLTDHPSFLSRRWFVCLDPHGSAIARPEHGGRQFPLPILRQEHPSIERCFAPAPNFVLGTNNYDGTVFRLPFRSPAQAKVSRISADVFGHDDFEQIVSLLTSSGAGMLLFTRHVLQLAVWQIDASGSKPQELLAITTENASEVIASRARVYGELSGELQTLWANWTRTGGVRSSHRHEMHVRGDRKQRSLWQVCIGFFPDSESRLQQHSEALATYGEKAIPEAGVAVALSNSVLPHARPVDGRFYCGLPLPTAAGLPVHVHGCFDLDQSRSGLTADTGAVGLGKERYLWNELLIERAVPLAWAEAIASLPQEIVEANVGRYYGLWPEVGMNAGALTRKLAVAVHRLLASCELFRVATTDGAEFVDLNSTMSLPIADEAIFHALVADGLALVDPPLPLHIHAGARANSLTLRQVTPKFLCDRYRSAKFTDIALSQAPFPALRKRDWLIAITKYIVATEQPALRGLPLALLSNGNLAAFGNANATHTYIATTEERAIFEKFPHWFIDPEYFVETGVKPDAAAAFTTLTPGQVLTNLEKVLPKLGTSEWREWTPSSPGIPNEIWLRTLFIYLRKCKDVIDLDQLKDFPLVPDQFGHLSSLGTTGTPLLRPEGVGHRRVIGALERLDVPLVTAGKNLTAELKGFAEDFAGGIWWANRPDVIDGLNDCSTQWSAKFDQFDGLLFGPILDLLSSLSEEGLSDDLLVKLKGIPLVPLNDGRLVSASEADLFVPKIEVPAFATADVQLVQIGPDARWRRLWKALDLPTLDLPTLVLNVIIPQYPSFDDDEKFRALEFLKMQLKAAYAEADKVDRAGELQEALRDAELIFASDGEYRSPCNLFDPEEAEIFNVLGQQAPVPDMKRYRLGGKAWLDFFRELGIKRHIDAADLLETIELYTKEPPNRHNRALANRILKHIDDKWEHFKSAKCASDGDERLLVDILSEMAWLPARVAGRGRLPGFRAPEDRFYAPSELYRGSLDHRVCSQAPLLGIPDPSGPVARALGMPQRPAVAHVTAHFDYLRELWSKGEGVAAPDMERSLAEILRFFGELSRESGPEPTAVSAKYADQRCLWHRRRSRFYRPSDCFAEAVNNFDPFKVQISGEGSVAAGLDLLGRKKAPDWHDHLDFLDQLATHKADESCDQEETRKVLYSLAQLAIGLPDDEKIEDELFVLLESGRLGIAADVWANDVPHLKGRLDLNSLPIVDDRVPSRLTYFAKRLSRHFTEELVEEPLRSMDRQLEALCNQVMRTLRSPEFSAGQRRLVSSEYYGIPSGYEVNAAQLELVPAISIQTQFWLDDGGDRLPIGGGDTKFFLDRGANRIWIATVSSRSARPHLARAVNRYSEPFSLRDLSALEAILFVEPEEIAEVLDEREVPRIGGDLKEDWRFVDASLTDEPATPEMPSGNEDDWQDEPTEGAIAGDASNNLLDQERGIGTSQRSPVSKGESVAQSTGLGGGSRDPTAVRLNETGVTIRIGTDSAPPTTPGHGNSGRISTTPSTGPNGRPSRSGEARGRTVQKGRYSTYVVHAGNANARDSATASQESEALNIGAAAVKVVLEYERQQGRTPKEMPHNNPGYDVVSTDASGKIRYVEIKGVDGAWGERGVATSHVQFKFAQLRPGETWLYVVEHARGPSKPTVYPIQAPASKVTQFVFDAGWKSVAKEESDDSNITPPAIGDRVMIDKGEIVEVTAIEKVGELMRMEVKAAGGAKRKVLWQPSNHTIIERDAIGTDDPIAP